MNFDFPTILVLATVLTGGIWLMDALMLAPKRRRLAAAGGPGGGEPGAAVPVHEPVLVEYARAFFPVILAVLLLRSFLVEPFRIPSGSMMPTLLVGDFILVNKFSYGLRLPVLNTRILDLGEPKRGDVVVFRYPREESVDYIKRIVGVPGDALYYRDKTLFVNGKPMPHVMVGEYAGVGAGASQSGQAEADEDLDGVKHRVLINPLTGDAPPGCLMFANGPITVPEGQYFAMGDNRDNSNDSRCWGFVPERNLVGKAFAIWMHWDGERPGLPIDFSRIGDVIR